MRLAALALAIVAAGSVPAVQMASQPWVTNRIARAIAALPPSEPPGDFAAVSNAAKNALSRAEAEAGFTDWEWAVDGEPYALPTGWKFVYQADWHTWQLLDADNTGMSVAKAGDENSVAFQFAADEWNDGTGILTATRTRLPTMADIAAATNGIPRITESENVSGRAANADYAEEAGTAGMASEAGTSYYAATANSLTDDHTVRDAGEIFAQLDAATETNAEQTAALAALPAAVTNIVREASGGIWDAALEVWWTPRMRNGSLTYEATTNVNLNAEN